MVIGNGLFANAFSQYKNDSDIIIFASGVSNSKEIQLSAYLREETLLNETLNLYPDKKIIYFSTTSILDNELKNEPYCKHKVKMEKIIQKYAKHYHIFRLSEVIGKTNNTTQILSFLADSIQNNRTIPIWENATRHLIDIDDAKNICSLIIENNECENKIIDITSPIRSNILDLIFILEEILQHKAKYTLIDKGTDYIISTEKITKYLDKLNIKFDEKYVHNLIHKYYKD